MGTHTIHIPPWRIVLTRMILDFGIGMTFGALIWIVPLACEGKIVEALKGYIEDSISLLQGLATIGGIVGGFVGLLHGLIVVAKLQKKDQVNSS